MRKLREALTAVTDRISDALRDRLFPEGNPQDEPRVIDLAPVSPPKGTPRQRRPPMESVMPRMGYRYHLSWTPPDGVLRRWWRRARAPCHPELAMSSRAHS